MKLLFRPVNPFIITQAFGENKACKPVDGSQKTITCDGNNPPPGWVSLYGPKGHQAIDLKTAHGQEVFASQDGIVYKIDTDPMSGLDVRIEHEKHGIKFRTIYEHLQGYQVKEGQKVRVGQLIGWADNTGWSSGDHLHFILEIFKDGVWERVDPMLYMDTLFAPEALKMEDTLLYLRERVARLLEALANKTRV